MNAPPDLHARFAATLERTEWLPRPQLENYRDDLLKRMVMFAFQSSPFAPC